MKLISMTDFVLQTYEKHDDYKIIADECLLYANFLKQPLTLGIFVPCDDDSALGCPLRYDLKVSERPFVDWETVELYFENMGLLKNEPKKKSRCCGRCDGVNDICHTDRICDKHTETGCEICFGER